MRQLKKGIWPYRITVVSFERNIENWCEEMLGRRFCDWYSYDTPSGRLYAFKDEETLLMFMLMWKTKKV